MVGGTNGTDTTIQIESNGDIKQAGTLYPTGGVWGANGAAGKVFTSDASGIGSWSNAPVAGIAPGTGITTSTNNGVVTINTVADTSSVTQTNFVLNTIYTNANQNPILVRASTFLIPALVNGGASLDLMYSPTGGINYALISRVAVDTLLTGGFTTPSTNDITAVITNQGNYYFTNTSAGAGNSAGLVSGTGQITVLGGGAQGPQGPAGSSGPFDNVLVTNGVTDVQQLISSVNTTNQIDVASGPAAYYFTNMVTNVVFQLTNTWVGGVSNRTMKFYFEGATNTGPDFTVTFLVPNPGGVLFRWGAFNPTNGGTSFSVTNNHAASASLTLWNTNRIEALYTPLL